MDNLPDSNETSWPPVACPNCGQRVPVRKDGTIVTHKYRRGDARQDETCKGTGTHAVYGGLAAVGGFKS